MAGGRVKYRVGHIVFLSVSADEETMGFGFDKEERAAMVASEPGKFLMPSPADERYNWMQVRLATLDERELAELITDAWCMVVSKKTAGDYFAAHPDLVPPTGGPAG